MPLVSFPRRRSLGSFALRSYVSGPVRAEPARGRFLPACFGVAARVARRLERGRPCRLEVGGDFLLGFS